MAVSKAWFVSAKETIEEATVKWMAAHRPTLALKLRNDVEAGPQGEGPPELFIGVDPLQCAAMALPATNKTRSNGRSDQRVLIAVGWWDPVNMTYPHLRDQRVYVGLRNWPPFGRDYDEALSVGVDFAKSYRRTLVAAKSPSWISSARGADLQWIGYEFIDDPSESDAYLVRIIDRYVEWLDAALPATFQTVS
jgi:hypothetical protein